MNEIKQILNSNHAHDGQTAFDAQSVMHTIMLFTGEKDTENKVTQIHHQQCVCEQ